MRFLQLTSSRFYGGPERQMLGLAKALPPNCEPVFASFGEGGRCDSFLNVVRRAGFVARRLRYDTPRLLAARQELATLLSDQEIDVLLCHGYKANLVGHSAARRVGIPVVAVSRGWTGESAKVRIYERIDRALLSRMDRVICVSEAQAVKVRTTGVPAAKVRVIRNSARADAFREPHPDVRRLMESFFPRPGLYLILSAGRLSPDKGFSNLIEAIASLQERAADVRLLVCGDGVDRDELELQVRRAGLSDTIVFAGFRDDLDSWMPNADLFVLPSLTEGLPNVLLEAHAGGVPVVATAVGGTPELVVDGETGFLVRPGDANDLATRMIQLLEDDELRRRLGRAARGRVREHFTFEVQAQQYLDFFDQLSSIPCAA
jgi:glycosyltransferase involved in cell wall biosynthesis